MPIKKVSQGFGDDLAKFTAATGIDKVAKVVANLAGYNDCGCSQRQETLNQMFPYKNNQASNNEQGKSSQ